VALDCRISTEHQLIRNSDFLLDKTIQLPTIAYLLFLCVHRVLISVLRERLCRI